MKRIIFVTLLMISSSIIGMYPQQTAAAVLLAAMHAVLPPVVEARLEVQQIQKFKKWEPKQQSSIKQPKRVLGKGKFQRK